MSIIPDVRTRWSQGEGSWGRRRSRSIFPWRIAGPEGEWAAKDMRPCEKHGGIGADHTTIA